MAVPVNIKDFAQGLAEQAQTGEPLILPAETEPNPIYADWDAASSYRVVLEADMPTGRLIEVHNVDRGQFRGLREQFEKIKQEKRRALEALQGK